MRRTLSRFNYEGSAICPGNNWIYPFIKEFLYLGVIIDDSKWLVNINTYWILLLRSYLLGIRVVDDKIVLFWPSTYQR